MKKRNNCKKLVVGLSTTLILIFLLALPCLAVLPEDTLYEPTIVDNNLYNTGVLTDSFTDFSSAYGSIDYGNSFFVRYDLGGGSYEYEPFIFLIDFYYGNDYYTQYVFTTNFLDFLSQHNSNIYTLNPNDLFNWFTSYYFDYSNLPVNAPRLIIGDSTVVENINITNYLYLPLQNLYNSFISQYSYFFNIDVIDDTYRVENNSLRNQIQNLVNYQIELEDEIARLEEDYIYQYNMGFENGQLLGYSQGLEDSETFQNGLFTIFDAPFHIVREVFSFDLFGINVANIILTLFTILIISFVIKLVL